MQIVVEDENGYTIPSTVSYVSITGEAVDTFIQIADRSSDLVIEMTDVNLTSKMGKNCISTVDGNFDFSEKPFTVTVILNGENVLIGSDYTDVAAQPAQNSGKKGGSGGTGSSGIVVPKLAITGNGSLVIYAGNGGEGGKGADSSGLSSAVYGYGGNGGNGGCGIACTFAVLSMDITGVVKLFSGIGGNGGSPGRNGSLLSGPINTSNWKNCYGNKGADGLPINGEYKTICGTLID